MAYVVLVAIVSRCLQTDFDGSVIDRLANEYFDAMFGLCRAFGTEKSKSQTIHDGVKRIS